MSRPAAIKTEPQQNPLEICWFDSAWIPFLNATNILEYFSKANSFYDRQCNNEIVKMQRQSLDVLKNMTGIEYILLHVKEPILYVIRKQHRHTPEDATPIANFYIIAGKIYQAPDLASIFNSRILGTVHNLQQAFDDAISYAKFHPTKGYSWDFSGRGDEKEVAPKKEEQLTSSSIFQRKRVDMLLMELGKKFPIPQIPIPEQRPEEDKAKNETRQSEPTIKQEPVDPTVPNSQISSVPPEKKLKINN